MSGASRFQESCRKGSQYLSQIVVFIEGRRSHFKNCEDGVVCLEIHLYLHNSINVFPNALKFYQMWQKQWNVRRNLRIRRLLDTKCPRTMAVLGQRLSRDTNGTKAARDRRGRTPRGVGTFRLLSMHDCFNLIRAVSLYLSIAPSVTTVAPTRCSTHARAVVTRPSCSSIARRMVAWNCCTVRSQLPKQALASPLYIDSSDCTSAPVLRIMLL